MLMVFYKNGRWHLCNEKVKYMQNDKEITQYVGSEDKQWWLDFEEKWEHTEIIEFIPVEPTQEQVDRLEEINQLNIPDGFGSTINSYVEKELFPEGYTHPLGNLKLQKENKELGIQMSEREIQEISQGQQISSLEIQMLELQGGM